MSNLIKFPDTPMGKTVERRYNELFSRMADLGMTPEQQIEMVIKTAKQMGLVEIDGVWQLPKQVNGEAKP